MKNLTLFSNPAILNQIGHVRVPKLLDQFAREFQAIGVALPNPPDPACPRPDPSHDLYFAAVAAILADGHQVPFRLGEGLMLIANAVAPENQERLNDSLQRLFPCVSVSGLCPLERALELWFSAPSELSQFASSWDQKSDPAPEHPSEAFDQNSQIAIQNSDVLDRLAKLSPSEYDRVRDRESQCLGLRKETLDKEVAKRRTELNDHRQAAAVVIPRFEPWPEPARQLLSRFGQRTANPKNGPP